MDFLRNIRMREEGRGNRCVLDYTLPRLQSQSSDVFKKSSLMGWTPVDNDNVEVFLEGECLVGRFCSHLCGSSGNPDLFAVADEEGHVVIQDTSKRGDSFVKSWFRVHDNAIFDLTWLQERGGAIRLVTASGDKSAAICDIETERVITFITSHYQSLRSICSHPDVPGLLVTGGRDGKICIHDGRVGYGTPVSTIVDAHNTDLPKPKSRKMFTTNRSVTSLVLKDEHCLVSGGFTDNQVKVWDLRRTYTENSRGWRPSALHTLPVGASVTSLVLKPGDWKLYVCCTNNSIFCFDAVNFETKPVCKFWGHKSSLDLVGSYLQCDVSSCGRYLACGSSGDTNMYIWSTDVSRAVKLDNEQELEVPHVDHIARLEGHRDAVTCVQWSTIPGELKLVSLSDDDTERIWTLGPHHSPEKRRYHLEGYAVMTDPHFYKPRPQRVPPPRAEAPMEVEPPHTAELPSFVHDPESVVHVCSPRVPKPRMDWLTALSPRNSPPSAGKVVKHKRPANGAKRKSSKQLQLASPHFKAVLKPKPAKM